MSKTEPIVQKFMTCAPHSVEEEKSLEEVQNVMKELNIRHLPVLKGGAVAGIISDRDIKTALGLVGADPKQLLVRDVFHGNPYQVGPETPLHKVVDEMANKHYGSAIVVQNGKLVGILTTVDVCRALSELLKQRYHVSR